MKSRNGGERPCRPCSTMTSEEKEEALDHVLALLDLFTGRNVPELVELCEEIRDRLDGML